MFLLLVQLLCRTASLSSEVILYAVCITNLDVVLFFATYCWEHSRRYELMRVMIRLNSSMGVHRSSRKRKLKSWISENLEPPMKNLKMDAPNSENREPSLKNLKMGIPNLIGQLVFAKLSVGSKWWPGIIINASDCGRQLHKNDQTCIFWFGDEKVSLIPQKRIQPFYKFSSLVQEKSSKLYQKAIYEALLIAACRVNRKSLKENDLISWAMHNFDNAPSFPPDSVKPLPENIVTKLKVYKREVESGKKVHVQNSSCGELQFNKPSSDSTNQIVWAKYGTRFWPAIVIQGADCGQPAAVHGKKWVFWFGEHLVSQVSIKNTEDYIQNFSHRFINSGKKYLAAISESLDVLSKQLGFTSDQGNNEDLIIWAKNGFHSTKINKSQNGVNLSSNVVAEYIRGYLEQLQTKSAQVEKKSDANKTNLNPKQLQTKSSAALKVQSGEVNIEDVCIACDSHDKDVKMSHPLFHGGLCNSCCGDIYETIFSYGNDGKNLYCVLCGQNGQSYICDNSKCNRRFCNICVKLWASADAEKKIMLIKPWYCFFCCKPKFINGFLRQRKDWEFKIRQGFNLKWRPDNSQIANKKKPLVVLSLFDGIGTGKYVLNCLKLITETYYASEIDETAMDVSSHHHNVIHLGDVTKISNEWLIEHADVIDLLIGGSPCNDLALVNPRRKGFFDFTGTGILFFEYLRILRTIQKYKNGRHLFWLYENVFCMPIKYKEIISKCFNETPVKLNASQFSSQNRERLFWGNIPGMNFIERYWSSERIQRSVPSHYLNRGILLQDCLVKGCGRTAMVQKIQSVTTQSNSLLQSDNIMPVKKRNGEYDVLWPTELEATFGLPMHYTDIGNLSARQRQRLLGKSWPTSVVEYLLFPLRFFYKIKDTAISADI